MALVLTRASGRGLGDDPVVARTGPLAERSVLTYGPPLLAIALMLPLQWLSDSLVGVGPPCAHLFCTVIVVAWYDGLLPGLAATVLFTSVCGYFFVPWGVPDQARRDLFRLAVFLVDGVLISALMESLHSTRRRAEAIAREMLGHQETLRRSEERLRAIQDSALDCIIAIDPAGRVIEFNPAAEETLGYGRAAAVGRPLADLITPPARDEHASSRSVARVLSSGRGTALGKRLEVTARRADGTEFPAEMVIASNHRSGPPLLTVFLRDITDRKRAELDLRDSQAFYHSLVENVPFSIFRKDLDGRYTFGNRRFCEWLGTTPEGLIGKTDYDFHPRETADHYRAGDLHVIECGTVLEIEEQCQPPSGHSPCRYVHTIKTPIFDGEGHAIGIQGVFEDVTEYRRALEAVRASEERYRLLFEANPHPMWVYDPESLAFLAVNEAAVRYYGYSREEFLAMTVADIRPPEDRPALLQWIAEQGHVPHQVSWQWRHQKRDGTVIDVDVVSHHLTFQGRLARLVLAHDITARKRAEEQLERQATHDALTGLPNRTLLRDQLDRSVAAAEAAGSTLALLLIDLDRFKEINDTFGHHHGDVVLQQLSPRLRGALRKSEMVARLGGDEFGIILPEGDEADAVRTAEKLLGQLVQPIVVDGQTLEVGASIGIALFPDHGRDANTLLQRADVAMYAAKRGQAGHVVYAAEQSESSPRRLTLISELRRGIEDDQFVIHYQPKVALGTMRTSAAEALIRWRHPREGLLPPVEFIPLAEHAGLIKPLSLWALESVLRQSRLWHAAGLNLNIAVNLATGSVQDERLVGTITELLRRTDTHPSWLTVEVTESTMMADPIRARETLSHLHEMGIKVSIDDFGTGYSSLSYLKELPVDEVKIDRSFVQDMMANEHSACIVRSVIDLGHNLGLHVVAEGVEEQSCLDLLAALGCDFVQGFLLSRPLPASEFQGWLGGSAGRRRRWIGPAAVPHEEYLRLSPDAPPSGVG